MKRFVIVVTCILLCFIFVFTCIGYAAISDTLQISGNATVTPPETVFISGVEVEGNATVTYSGTSLFVTGSGPVTVSVTFFNNTAEVHKYNGISMIDSAFRISSINIQRGVEIAISGTLVAEVTFSITGNVADGNGVVFQFVKADDFVNNAVDQFEDILNNEDSFKELEEILNNYPAGGAGQRGDTSYIQNTGNNADEVNKIVNELFDVNGDSVLDDDTTVLIKREDNNNMPEGVDVMTLYFANTSNITSAPFLNRTVNVNIAIFVNINNNWVQIVNQDNTNNGGMFTGTASATYYDYAYKGWWGTHPIEDYDSIDTGSWNTTSQYTVNGVTKYEKSTVADIVGEYLKGIP